MNKMVYAYQTSPRRAEVTFDVTFQTTLDNLELRLPAASRRSISVRDISSNQVW